MFFLFLLLLVSSTVMYSYLHFKTRMNLRFLYMDNLLVTVISFLAAVLVFYLSSSINNFGLQFIMALIVGEIFVVAVGLYGNNDSLLAHSDKKSYSKRK